MREFQNDFKLPATLAYAPWKAIEVLPHCILLLTSVEFAVYSFFFIDSTSTHQFNL